MADLQSCYFCGAPDDVDEYAVVPPRLGGGDRSVALCPDCKTKLLRVMEPLIERAEGGADGGETADSPSKPTGESDDGGVTMSTGETAPSGSDADSQTSPAAAETDGDTPPQYRRAMRMLSNRPFPINRGEVESMLANAYDLEREGIDAVLEHAEAEGRLVAADGEIREP